jgi:LSD1 subclass zinc finger protein
MQAKTTTRQKKKKKKEKKEKQNHSITPLDCVVFIIQHQINVEGSIAAQGCVNLTYPTGRIRIRCAPCRRVGIYNAMQSNSVHHHNHHHEF